MRVPDLEEDIETRIVSLNFICKNCGINWSKHKMTKGWQPCLACPTIPGTKKSYFRSMAE